MLANYKINKLSDTSSIASDVDGTEDVRSIPVTLSVQKTAVVSKNDNPKKKINIKTLDSNTRKSSVERNAELTSVKIDAINQLENTIKMADIIDNKNLKITVLQSEVQSLKVQVKQLNSSLVDSKRLNRELMEKLELLTNTNSRQKIELENLRASNLTNDLLDLPATSDPSYARYLNEIIDHREKLIVENDGLKRQVDETEGEVAKLKSYVSQLEAGYGGNLADYKYIEETTVEDRSKSDLLKIVRTLMDDKMVWMEYAIRLTRIAVSQCPQLLDLEVQQEGTGIDARWAQFSVHLLEKLSRSCPNLLPDMLASADPDQFSYLKSTLK